MKIPPRLFPCNCGIPITDHVLDRYGKTQRHADWRKRVSHFMTKRICDLLLTPAVTKVHTTEEDDGEGDEDKYDDDTGNLGQL